MAQPEPDPIQSTRHLAAAAGVQLSGASLSYSGRRLFDRLDVSLEPGVLTCLLGRSGIGKSTLLKMLAGIIPLNTGASVNFRDGRPLAGRVAYMDQRDLLLPWLDVIANVTLGARLRGERADIGRAEAILAQVGLQGCENDRPASLSGGMRQRAALARTLMEDRPVVLMDEPFASVDALTRYRLQDLTVELLKGRTVLLVTHDPLEAVRIGERIHVMNGSPANLGPPLVLGGNTPRDPTSDIARSGYHDLLNRLADNSMQAEQVEPHGA